jgi:hypothetical protein
LSRWVMKVPSQAKDIMSKGRQTSRIEKRPHIDEAAFLLLGSCTATGLYQMLYPIFLPSLLVRTFSQSSALGNMPSISPMTVLMKVRCKYDLKNTLRSCKFLYAIVYYKRGALIPSSDFAPKSDLYSSRPTSTPPQFSSDRERPASRS